MPALELRSFENALIAKSLVTKSRSPVKWEKSFWTATVSTNAHTSFTVVSGFSQFPIIASHCFVQNAWSASIISGVQAVNGSRFSLKIKPLGDRYGYIHARGKLSST